MQGFLSLTSRMLIAIVLCAGVALADDANPTPDEAKALALKAAALIADKGLADAAVAFNSDGEYKHGAIYVTVIDFAGVWKVYPPRPAGVGQNMLNVKDPDGKLIVHEILRIATGDGEGWVDYRWANPETKKIEPKTTYVKRVSGQDLVAYVGVYK